MKYKILVGLSLSIFSIIIGYVLVVGYFISDTSKSNYNSEIIRVNQSDTTDIADSVGSVVTGDSLAVHDTEADCWVEINGSVYDVTGYLTQHPGGDKTILKYCGKDGTQAFATKDSSPEEAHSDFAIKLLSEFIVGKSSDGLVVDATNSASTGSGKSANDTVISPTDRTIVPVPVKFQTLSSSVVSTHNNINDCWIIVSNNVYDVTTYFGSHPGGTDEILPYCGKDATLGFQTKGGQGNNHSGFGYTQLNEYLVGELGTQIQVSAGTSPAAVLNSGSPSNSTTSSSSLPTRVNDRYPGASIIEQQIEDDGRQEIMLLFEGSCLKVKTNSAGNIVEQEGSDDCG